MKSLVFALSFVTFLLVSVSSEAVDLADNYGRLINEGIDAAGQQNLDAAVTSFNDAHLTRPGGREALMNLGLSLAGSGRFDEAIERFGKVASSARLENPPLAAQALYNRGRAQFDKASVALENSDMEAALPGALDALRSFNEALDLDESLSEAHFNREQTRHLIERIAELQQQQQEQPEDNQQDDGEENQEQKENEGENDNRQDRQQPDEGEDDKQQDEGENNEDRQSNEGEEGRDQEQQSSQDDESDDGSEENRDQESNQQDEEDGEPRDESAENNPSDDQQEDASGGDSENEPQQMGQMTPEQARNLLRHLGREKLMPVRLHNRARVVEKEW